MKKNIHPAYNSLKVRCTKCGNHFETASTLKQSEYNPERCTKCHPFYTKKYGASHQINNKENSRQSLFQDFSLSSLVKQKD